MYGFVSYAGVETTLAYLGRLNAKYVWSPEGVQQGAG
jgi:hypothetical protein